MDDTSIVDVLNTLDYLFKDIMGLSFGQFFLATSLEIVNQISCLQILHYKVGLVTHMKIFDKLDDVRASLAEINGF